ncbi:DUF222 domain-containing protein [Streptomyces sp. SID13031]|uniref:DUF222 domain-containing protein n=1 Tax=Streptomyces sp. SID13031 TaxID=2706046 RepID=UPI0013C93B7D|nr:DUF222 domain-containing protein [Streptomyces sp. SID13031]NEA35786.1 DUF222 domain-containing protein [Streptomyces sp. SID13031]
MFPLDLEGYDARATLDAAAEMRALQSQAEVAEIRLGLHFVDLHPDPATLSEAAVRGGERGVVYGGAGCPVVGEFAAAEFGAVTGRSAGAAARFLGEALALRHRLPLVYAQMLSGHAAAWKARKIAAACMELSQEAAAIVDRRVAGIIDSVPPLRLANIVRAAMWEADPEIAQAKAEERARKRGVWAGRTDEHGTTMLFVRASTGDVIRFNANVTQIANALAALGDTDSLDQRRAKAIGVIADPALADKLLQVAQHLTASPEFAGQFEPGATAGDADEQAADQAAEERVWGAPTATRRDESVPAPAAESAGQADDIEFDHESDGDDFTDDSPYPSSPAFEGYLLDPPQPLDSSRSSDRSSDRVDEAQEPDRGMDWTARRELGKKISAIRQSAYTTRRPRQTVIYAHITDEVLLAGQGVARVEGYGPVYVKRLQEFLGHDQVVIQPVIDLRVGVSVDAYEIPRRIREQVKLTYPVEQFPYGTAMTTDSIDLDHIEAFDPNGPPKQTSTENLSPLRRFSHRVKTHGDWKVQRVDDHTQEWTTRHGFKFRVDHLGTHRVEDDG